MPISLRVNLSVGLLIACACCLLSPASCQCVTNGIPELVNSVVRRELDLASSQGRWMYLARYKKHGIRIEARKIQTDDGLLTWILSRDEVPLSPPEIQAQRQRMNELVSDASFLDANRKAMHEDAVRINTLLADLPGSVQFDCLTKSGATVTVHFGPKTGYSPWSIEKRILAGMSGTLQIDLNEMRLLTASGKEQSDISMFLGAGRIYKGSSVSFTRTQVAPGIWETSQASTHIKGQIFFLKSIAQDSDESIVDYAAVPSGLSARAALPYLEK